MQELDVEVSGTIGSAWASSTLKTRSSQWKRYLQFCDDNELQSMPASARTVARFLVFQARTSRYNTVNNCLSAINRLHQTYGYQMEFRQFFLIKMVLSGIKRQLGDSVRQKIPLTPVQMLQIYSHLDMTDPFVSACWCAIMLSFRTLLRKSNIIPDTADSLDSSAHLVRRNEIVFSKEGAVISVHSTKTLQYQERCLQIPLQLLGGSPFCVVSLLKDHMMKFPGPPNGILFYKRCGRSNVPLFYRDVLKFLKDSVGRIGMDPSDVGLHSLRRSGAAYLHSIGIPLIDIQCIGDWRSLAVLSYLITPIDRKIDIEHKFASTLLAI